MISNGQSDYESIHYCGVLIIIFILYYIFETQDTGSNGCYKATVDLEHLELCSPNLPLNDAKLRFTVTYTDAETGERFIDCIGVVIYSVLIMVLYMPASLCN